MHSPNRKYISAGYRFPLYPGYDHQLGLLHPALLRAGAPDPASGLAARRTLAARSVPLPR